MRSKHKSRQERDNSLQVSLSQSRKSTLMLRERDSANKIKKSNLKSLFQILMIDPEKRSLNDIKLVKQIMLDIEAMRKIQSTGEFDYICKQLVLIKLKNGEFVFQKDKGMLYIILQGSVGIYNRENKDTLDEVYTLRSSQCFGDIIQSPDGVKNFIALSLEDSILAVITSQSYRRFQELESTSLSSLEKLMREFRLFDRLSPQQLDYITKKSCISKVPSNTTVIREGEIPKALFLVRKGILKVYRDVKYLSALNTSPAAEQEWRRQDKKTTVPMPFTQTLKTFAIKELSAGDYFPMSDLKLRHPVPCTIVTFCPCELVLIPYRQIEGLLEKLEGMQGVNPTDSEIRLKYASNRQWEEYREELIQDVFRRVKEKKELQRLRM